jgi:hypothetical protein
LSIFSSGTTKTRSSTIAKQLFDREGLAVVNDRLSLAPALGAHQLDALLSHSAPKNMAFGDFKTK